MPDITSISWWRERTTKMGKFFGWGCVLIFGLPLVIGFGWNQYSGRNNQSDTGGGVVVAKINGESITKNQMQNSMGRSSGSGVEYAYAVGGAVDRRVRSSAILQLAKKYNIKVSDADVDRTLAEEKTKNVGPKATEAEWDDYVYRAHGMTTGDYREALAKEPSMMGEGLILKFKNEENVSTDEAKALNDEVSLRTILIGAGKGMFPAKNGKDLTDEQAKKLAEDLYAKIKAGADFAKTAKGVSTDFNSKDGAKSNFLNESQMLSQFYGKTYAETIKKTAKGQMTPVIKTEGFLKGYAFSLVEDRKNNAPKDFDAKKAADDLKKQRASEKLGKEMELLYNATPVVFTKDGQDYKAYYDNYKVALDQQKLQNAMQAKMMGQEVPADLPTKESIAEKQKLVDTEIEALYNRHKDESVPAILFIPTLKKRLAVATGAEKTKLQDQLISAYDTALKGAEDQKMRFDLADLYNTKGDKANATATYKQISHYADLAPGFDLNSKTAEQEVRKQLMTRFRAVQLEDEALKQQKKAEDLAVQIDEEKKKAAAASPPPGMSTRVGKPAK